jgi:hypothetical protein
MKDLSQWLTRAEAAALLGVSEKTVERMEAKREITRADRRRFGKKPEPVYNPEELRLILDTAVVRPATAPPEVIGASTSVMAARPTRDDRGSSLATVLTTSIEQLVKALSPDRVSLRDKVFLTLEEARAFSGLPLAPLMAAVKDGTVRAIRNGERGQWRISRRSLEEMG